MGFNDSFISVLSPAIHLPLSLRYSEMRYSLLIALKDMIKGKIVDPALNPNPELMTLAPCPTRSCTGGFDESQ